MNIKDNQTKTFNPNRLNFLDSILTPLTFDESNPVNNSKKIKTPKEIMVKCSKPKYFSKIEDIPTNGSVNVIKFE
jgi:hypothetical protein